MYIFVFEISNYFQENIEFPPVVLPESEGVDLVLRAAATYQTLRRSELLNELSKLCGVLSKQNASDRNMHDVFLT